jgi:hypothetical protein
MDDEYMLSTSDNPFNPYTHWEQWYAFDAAAGYHTPSYLARVVVTSNELSEADQDLAIKDGIDEILQYNITGKYVKAFPVAAP